MSQIDGRPINTMALVAMEVALGIIVGAFRATVGPNKYGPDPYEGESPAADAATTEEEKILEDDDDAEMHEDEAAPAPRRP